MVIVPHESNMETVSIIRQNIKVSVDVFVLVNLDLVCTRVADLFLVESFLLLGDRCFEMKGSKQ